MWAPDAAEKGGKYYLYFPVKDKQDVFRIGAAVGDKPGRAVHGAAAADHGQLQHRSGGLQGHRRQVLHVFRRHLGRTAAALGDAAPTRRRTSIRRRISPRSARRSRASATTWSSFAEAPKDVVLLDENGKPLTAGDNGRRFFEAAWLHKYNGTYYFSYSTGDTHFIMYATGTSPYGPFTVRGKILEPVLGWTNHHSIVEFQGKWYLFYHDAQLSGGQTHLRNIKVTELKYRPDGSIVTIDAYIE